VKLYVISFLLLSLTVLAPSKVLSQNDSELDSARLYIDIAKQSLNTDTIKMYAKLAYEIASKRQNIPLLVDCANQLAYAYGTERKFDSAIVFYKRHYIIVSDDTSRAKDMATTLGNLGICYKNIDKYIDMWRSFRQSKTIFEKLQDTVNICWTTIEMGEAYEHFGMYQQAQELYDETIKLATRQNLVGDIARCHYNIGNIILKENFGINNDTAAAQLLRARRYITKAVDESYNHDNIYADTLRYAASLSLAQCYIAMLHAMPERTDYADSCSLQIEKHISARSNKSIPDSLDTETIKAMLKIYRRKYADAINILENAVQLPVKVAYSREMSEAYKLLSESYTAIGKVKEAYTAKKKYYEIFDKISNEENIKRSANFAAQTEIDVEREKQKEENRHRETLEAANQLRRQSIIKGLTAGLGVAAVITLVIIVSLRKKNRLGKQLNDLNNQLLAQRNVIEQQKNDEQQAQSIILSSVEYASKIQSQAISNETNVASIFPESFVYYRPRNIVSGDWYMATVLKGHRIMIEADCTGHGIPGALLCMLGVSAMKDIINKLRHTPSPILPGLMLDEMRVAVKKALNKDTGDSKSNIDDGMDMTIIILTPEGGKMLFGSANQNAILVSGGNATRLKGDANPIGNYVREKEHFTTTEMPVSKGDAVYLFSDGIQDQTGDNERKYSLKRLTAFLADHYTLPMPQQKAEFEKDFNDYAGSQPQVDDRTLVGIRI